MKIVIDARRVRARMAGLGIYVRNLLIGLNEVAGDHEIYACTLPEAEVLLPELPRIIRWRVPWPVEDHLRGDWWKHVTLPAWLEARQIDIYHEPAYQLPFRKAKVRQVVTVHDLSPFVHPETNTKKYNVYWRTVTRMAVRRACRIVAVSAFTQREILERFDISPRRVVVVPSPVSPGFTPGATEDDILRRYGIRRPYMLTAARYEPRKNIQALLRALPEIRRRVHLDIRVVAAGEAPPASGAAWGTIRRLGIADLVRFTGYVPEQHLVSLVRAASLVVVPSVYEGFGYPVLEALGCGVPVAASRCASLPEVGGDLARYFDPADSGDVAATICRVLKDDDLRRKIAREGPAHTARFHPETVAASFLKLYASVLQTGRP